MSYLPDGEVKPDQGFLPRRKKRRKQQSTTNKKQTK